VAWAAGCTLCLLFFSKVVDNGKTEDGGFSLAATLGIEPSEKTTREQLTWLWHASSETEPYGSIVKRSLWLCGGAARRSELVRLASCHPRARVDPCSVRDVLLERHSAWQGLGRNRRDWVTFPRHRLERELERTPGRAGIDRMEDHVPPAQQRGTAARKRADSRPCSRCGGGSSSRIDSTRYAVRKGPSRSTSVVRHGPGVDRSRILGACLVRRAEAAVGKEEVDGATRTRRHVQQPELRNEWHAASEAVR
jgi:hypothetical protein